MFSSPTGRLVQSQPSIQNLPIALSPRERQDMDAVRAAFRDEQLALFRPLDKMAQEARATLAVMSSMRHAGLMRDVARTMAWLAHCEQLHKAGAWFGGESPDPRRLTCVAQTVREMLDSPGIDEDSPSVRWLRVTPTIDYQYGDWLH